MRSFPLLQLEEAAKEVADEVTRPRPAGDELLQDIQVMLKSDASPSSIRILKVGVYWMASQGGMAAVWCRRLLRQRAWSTRCATLTETFDVI